VIGVGVMNWFGAVNWYGTGVSGKEAAIYREYLSRVALFVVRLLERGDLACASLSAISRTTSRVRRDLAKVLQARGVSFEDGRVIDKPAASVDALLAQLGSVDVAVSARFHNLRSRCCSRTHDLRPMKARRSRCAPRARWKAAASRWASSTSASWRSCPTGPAGAKRDGWRRAWSEVVTFYAFPAEVCRRRS
jgi:hypothetical protein